MKNFLLFFFMALSIFTRAQYPIERGFDGNNDAFSHVSNKTSNGFVFAGEMGSNMDSLFVLVVDSTLNHVNAFSYTGPIGKIFQVKAIVETDDHGFMVAGNIADTSTILRDYFFLMRIDSLGNILFAKQWANIPHEDASITDILKSATNKYYLIGTSNGMTVYKFDQNGNLIFNRVITSTYNNKTAGHQHGCFTSDGNIFVAGDHGIYDSTTWRRDLFCFKMDTTGNIISQKSIQLAKDVSATTVFAENDNKVLISGGISDTAGTPSRQLLIKMDTSVYWVKQFTENSNYIFNLNYGIFHDDKYVIEGSARPTNQIMYTLQLDTAGNILQTESYSHTLGAQYYEPLGIFKYHNVVALTYYYYLYLHHFASGVIVTDSLLKSTCPGDSVSFATTDVPFSDSSMYYVHTQNLVDTDLTLQMQSSTFLCSIYNSCTTTDIKTTDNYSFDIHQVDESINIRNKNNENTYVVISNSIGQVIQTYNFYNEISIDLSPFSDGIYFLRINTCTYKFIK